ncbi:MAG TPA: penicillin-binding protein 2 [Cellvibrionaceae bacterium]|nr:penicillin-binding protein 2 [Cellvibrionaceae bacterium]HNG58806.1 penicillin-binding protein 2 [Cellvibrionaceae bacterium]
MIRLLAKWRLTLLCALLGIMPGAMIWHLAQLQVLPGQERGYDFLQQQGQSRTLRQEKISAYRGMITDRNGELLAVSTPVQSIFVNPQKVDSKDFPRLAKALKLTTVEIEKKIAANADRKFIYLARKLPPHDAEEITQLQIPGVGVEEEYERYYPAGEVAAHLVGFTNIDDHGQEGMELALDSWLTGSPGTKEVIKDLKGNVVKELGLKKSAVAGKDVQLSIDLRLQYVAHKALKAQVEERGALSGSVVVLNAKTGEILAMANQPSFNPNNRTNVPLNNLRNRAITDVVEPGSTIKPFTVMAALETGRYKPDTIINTSPGYLQVGSKTLKDKHNLGPIDLTTIIQKSSQIGISKLALDLEPQSVRDLLHKSGFGEITGVGFPGESAGVLPSHAKWQPIERATLAFGMGMSATPLQLAQAYLMIANQGRFHSVSLLKKDAKVLDDKKPEQIVSPKVAAQMNEMLKTVVQPGGTAYRARLESYSFAGKTGTAHKVDATGYAENKYVAIFAGMAPADNPEIVSVVVINEPTKGSYYGGDVAAPVFAKVADGSLRLLNVPPALPRQVAAASP